MAKKPTPPNIEDYEESDIGVSYDAAKRLGVIASSAPLQTGTLAGDVRDTLLDLYKTRPKTWSQMTEAEQQDIGRALEYAARELVKGVVDTIRTDGQEAPVRAILEGYTDKGDVKAALKIKTGDEEDANRTILALHKARGKMVLITIASPDDYLGEREALHVDPDQSGLKFEGDAKPDWNTIEDILAEGKDSGEDAELAGDDPEFAEVGEEGES